ncbi:hypothetical protein PsorP6_017816 [Peronosclerospora sorghi]|uniref:Uncharacterized protein n=1 Tax=Peronosclerospora sorghi TaxID=230839 RepID=A0ACC0WEA7_9STRA|nr:hypothetical protein PsorP6_017816 [Peronosclerospora sorghi]
MKTNEPRLVVVRTCLEAIYVLAHYLSPIIPQSTEMIFKKLGTVPSKLTALSPHYDNLKSGTEVSIGDILFRKILTEEKLQVHNDAAAAKAQPAKAKPAQSAVPLYASLDIRVDVISKVWKHPESEKLYCEEIDIGEENQSRLPLPAKVGGFKSHGMVLCASDEAHKNVEFVEPPADSKVGERVTIASESSEPLSAAQIKKQKVLEKVSPDFRTNDKCVATY